MLDIVYLYILLSAEILTDIGTRFRSELRESLSQRDPSPEWFETLAFSRNC